MDPDTTYSRSLQRALVAMGSETRLAEELHTSPEVLRKWLSGELTPPNYIQLAVLNIVVKKAGATR